MLQDLRLALRLFRTTPVVTSVAVLSLALGVGANTAIFSIADTLLMRALPVERPDRLVLLSATPPGATTPVWNNAAWEQIRERRHDLFQTAGTLGIKPGAHLIVNMAQPVVLNTI